MTKFVVKNNKHVKYVSKWTTLCVYVTVYLRWCASTSLATLIQPPLFFPFSVIVRFVVLLSILSFCSSFFIYFSSCAVIIIFQIYAMKSYLNCKKKRYYFTSMPKWNETWIYRRQTYQGIKLFASISLYNLFIRPPRNIHEGASRRRFNLSNNSSPFYLLMHHQANVKSKVLTWVLSCHRLVLSSSFCHCSLYTNSRLFFYILVHYSR